MRAIVVLGFAIATLGACTHTTERERVVVEPQRGSTVVVPGSSTTTPGRTNETTVVVPR